MSSSSSPVTQPFQLDELRQLTSDCIDKNQLSTARFYADKCCALSNHDPFDVFYLSKVFYLKKEFHRCIHLLQTNDLIPHPNEMGLDDNSFHSKLKLLSRMKLECANQDIIHNILQTESERQQQQQQQQQQHTQMQIPITTTTTTRAATLLNSKQTNSKLFLLECLLLGMQAFLGCGEYESAVMILGNSDEKATEIIDDSGDDDSRYYSGHNHNHYLNISSLICLTRAKALQKLQNYIRTRDWLKQALIFDCKNIEAFECIVNQRLETSVNLTAFVNSDLQFSSENEQWIKFYYMSKINEICCEYGVIATMNEKLENAASSSSSSSSSSTVITKDTHPHNTGDQNDRGRSSSLAILSASTDMQIISANCLSNLHLYRESYAISNQILSENPYNMSALTSHIICLTEMGKQSELYKHSHNLICAYPSSPISWFAVGCYYYMTRRQEIARKFLSKSTAIDMFFIPAWIVFGHTFAEQDADEQAINAYRMAHRLFPESHQPLLYMAMGYLNMNNFLYAEKFLLEAYSKFAADPMLYNELGVCYYHQQRFHKAIDFFKTAIKHISPDCYNTWESIFFNLGHCYRKLAQFDSAHKCYLTALNISPRDPQILCAIAFTHHLQDALEMAIEYYHKVLSISAHDTFANEMLYRALDEQYQKSITLPIQIHKHNRGSNVGSHHAGGDGGGNFKFQKPQKQKFDF